MVAGGKSSLRLVLPVVALSLLASWEGAWQWFLTPVYPGLDEYLYTRVGLWRLIWQHLVLVSVSSALSVGIGVVLAVFVTRSAGRDFLPAVNSLVSVGQTFPPVAVLALAVPAVGFGAQPTIIALFLYGLLPVVRNTITGLQSVAPEVRESATGMGMTEGQRLWRVEFPLALPVIMAGIKISVVINIGTATIGATIGAGGLGAPIITGLAADNPAFILQGSVLAALFAIIADAALEWVETRLRTVFTAVGQG
ncbi:MAG: ABC transporter permease [Thermodesulfobacteriota bacterium]